MSNQRRRGPGSTNGSANAASSKTTATAAPSAPAVVVAEPVEREEAPAIAAAIPVGGSSAVVAPSKAIGRVTATTAIRVVSGLIVADIVVLVLYVVLTHPHFMVAW